MGTTIAIAVGLVGLLAFVIVLYGKSKGAEADAKAFKSQADEALDAVERANEMRVRDNERARLAARLRARRDRDRS